MNQLCSSFTRGRRICAIGIFDGVHKGHQALLNEVLARAKKSNLIASVITFFPHPATVIAGIDIPLIMPVEKRVQFLENMGLEVCAVRFSKNFSKWTAKKFCESLKLIGVEQIIVGEDFRCGKDSASGAFLKSIAEQSGISLSLFQDIILSGERISSQRIRQALRDGNVVEAETMLGRRPTIYGVVKKGRRLGRKLGFPTANFTSDSLNVFKAGVYVAQTHVSGERHWGLLFIGRRPTFNGRSLRAEIYLLNFEEVLYNKEIEVEVVSFIRGEKRFSSVEALKDQIKKDERFLKKFIATG